MVEFSSLVLRVFMMTINSKSERNDQGKCLGWPVTSYGPDYGVSNNTLQKKNKFFSFQFSRQTKNLSYRHDTIISYHSKTSCVVLC